MKAIILAAGYATRLYPLTKDTAKPLLEVSGRTILDHLMEKVEQVSEIDHVFIVTNAKFAQSFIDWRQMYQGDKRVTVVNDQTTTNDNRLGAIGDIHYVIETEKLADDLLVLAGDNLFEFELTDFVAYYQRMNADCITVHQLNDPEELKQMGVVMLAETNRVIAFDEKPTEPKSNVAAAPFYLYQKETLPLIKHYLDQGNNPDAPGYFVSWLINQKPVYAFQFEGLRYDIGTIANYHKAQQLF